MLVPVADVKFNVLPLIFIVILSVIENPQIFVAVSVKVIVLPEIAVVGIVYDVFKLLEFEKVPEVQTMKHLFDLVRFLKD